MKYPHVSTIMSLAVALQRLALYKSYRTATLSGDVAAINLVQPPKIAEADLRRLFPAPLQRLWANTGLGGVEGMCDSTLGSALKLHDAADTMKHVVAVAEHKHGPQRGCPG